MSSGENLTKRPANKQPLIDKQPVSKKQPVNEQQSANNEGTPVPEPVIGWQRFKLSWKLKNFLIFLLGGVILMIGSGLAVYYIFCIPPKPIPDQASALGITSPRPAIFTNNSLTPALRNEKPINCPSFLPAHCPDHPVCHDPPPCAIPAAVPCPPRPKQVCLPCPTYPPCNKENCFLTCPTTTRPPPTTTPSDIVLSPQEIYNTDVLDLYRRYPVNSYNRLQIIIKVLELGAEYYYKTFTSRNCIHDYRHACTFCTDRYTYLRCVMENDVQGYIPKYDRTKLRKEEEGFPKEFRRRAYDSSYAELPLASILYYNYYLRDVDYAIRWSNHQAMTLWYEKTPNGTISKDCQSCRSNIEHVDNIKCIIYKGWDRG